MDSCDAISPIEATEAGDSKKEIRVEPNTLIDLFLKQKIFQVVLIQTHLDERNEKKEREERLWCIWIINERSLSLLLTVYRHQIE